MSKPEVSAGLGRYRLIWQNEQIQAEISRVREHSGETTSELLLKTTAPGLPAHLHHARLNLTSTTAKASLVRHLATRWNSVNWADIVEQLAVSVLREIRKGEPILDATGEEDAEPLRLLLSPLMPENEPAILFGPGGVGKSYLAMVMAIAVQLPWTDNPLGLITQEHYRNVLWLDWETSFQTFNWRLRRLRAGMQLPSVTLRYRRCRLPLADDIEAVQRVVDEERIGLVVADSLFGAIGGELKETDPAARFFRATREIPTTWLLITHVPKGGEGKEASPFGCVFFENESRAVWEVKRAQEAGAKVIDVGLYHKKDNDLGKQRPLGFRLTFGDDWTKIECQRLESVPELAKSLRRSDRILHILRSGAMTVREIADLLDESADMVAPELSRLKRAGRLIQLADHRWGRMADPSA